LKSLMLKCPIHELPYNIVINMQGFLFTTKIYWMLLVLDHLHL
jgi:hypothetical protein